MKQKAATPRAAAELYTSPLFRGRRRFVDETCDAWYVLSAKHGLLRPTDLVAPYDETLTTASQAERRAWSERVLRELEGEIGSFDGLTFEIHAGAAYRDFGLVDGLRAAGATVEVPAAGLAQGEQLAFYARHPAGTDSGPSSGRPARTAGPAPLAAWLAEATSPVELSFDDVEAIVGRTLPPSARRHRAWWANSPSQVLPRQWLEAGWRADSVDLDAGWIRLVR